MPLPVALRSLGHATFRCIALLDLITNETNVELELARAVQRHNRGQARVIPILFRACLWQDAPFGNLAVLPLNGKAIGRGTNKDHIYADIASAVKMAIEEWAKKH